MSEQNSDLQVIRTVSLLTIAAVCLTSALIFTRAAMIPLVFSLILYSLITEATDWFAVKLRWPRWLSLLVVFVTFLGIVTSFVWLATASIDTFVQGISQYQLRIQEFLIWISQRSMYLGYSFNIDKLSETLSNLPILDWATGITGVILEFIGNFSLVMIFLIFLLIGEQKGQTRHPVMLEVRNKISSFVAVKTLGSFAISIAVTVLLASLRIEMIFLFAAITFAANYIPQVGSLIAAALPIPVILLQYGAGVELLLFLSISIVLQLLSGNFIETKLMGEKLDLHPVTILVFLIFWGLVWGVAGMFVAVPITYVLKWGLSRHSITKAVSEILAGRLPRSTPSL